MGKWSSKPVLKRIREIREEDFLSLDNASSSDNHPENTCKKLATIRLKEEQITKRLFIENEEERGYRIR